MAFGVAFKEKDVEDFGTSFPGDRMQKCGWRCMSESALMQRLARKDCEEDNSTISPGLNLRKPFFGCGFFAYNWKLPAYSGASLLTVDILGFSAYNCSFFTYSFSFSTYSWSFFAYSGKVRLISALRDCKQRSLTVSKKAPTVSKKSFPRSPLCPDLGKNIVN